MHDHKSEHVILYYIILFLYLIITNYYSRLVNFKYFVHFLGITKKLTSIQLNCININKLKLIISIKMIGVIKYLVRSIMFLIKKCPFA